jgi:lipopolysaccharide biosynthesis glycosyltransferase
MNIIYTCDNNFIWIAGISMISLFKTNKRIEILNVYLLGDNVSNENKTILKQIADNYGRKFQAIDVPPLNIPNLLCSQRWPRSAFTRLFSAQLLPHDIDRAIYLDCDTIITDDLSDLESKDVNDYTIYGVKDCVGKYYKRNIGLADNSPYINVGVLLINLNRLRTIDINMAIEKFLNNYAKSINYADQDVLNGIFKGQIGELNPKYDMMTLLYAYTYKQVMSIRHPTNYYEKKTIDDAKANPAIVHFTTCMLNIRPWYECSKHPYAKDFEKYWRMSPWTNIRKKKMIFNSNEHKILKIIFTLPDFLAFPILGYMHSVLRPLLLNLKAKIK